MKRAVSDAQMVPFTWLENIAGCKLLIVNALLNPSILSYLRPKRVLIANTHLFLGGRIENSNEKFIGCRKYVNGPDGSSHAEITDAYKGLVPWILGNQSLLNFVQSLFLYLFLMFSFIRPCLYA